jgi:hypothetical protein
MVSADSALRKVQLTQNGLRKVQITQRPKRKNHGYQPWLLPLFSQPISKVYQLLFNSIDS